MTIQRDILIDQIETIEDAINATPVVIDEQFGIIDLQIELRALQAQQRVIKTTPDIADWHELQFDERFKNKQWVTLTQAEKDYLAVT